MTQQAGQPMMQGGPRTQEVIWEGELQWKENVKAADGKPVSSGNKTIHTVRCQAKASKASISSLNFPQLINVNTAFYLAGRRTRKFRG